MKMKYNMQLKHHLIIKKNHVKKIILFFTQFH